MDRSWHIGVPPCKASFARAVSALQRNLTPLNATILALVAVHAANAVFYYRVSVDMGAFVFVWGSVLYPVLYCVAILPVVIFQYTKGRLTKATTSYPLKRLAFMAFLDQSYNLLSSWPIPVLGGAVSNVLSRCSLPLNMALAYWVLKGEQRPRYGWSHYVGALTCICASIVQVLPDLLSGHGTASAGSTAAYGAWVAVMVLSALPNAASNVYKERELKLLDALDVWYVNFVVGLFQVAFGAATLPLVSLPFLPDRVGLETLPAFLYDGLRCFVGHNPTGSGSANASSCSRDPVTAAGVAVFYLTCNVVYSVLMLVIFRDGSSALYSVASASSLALISVLLLVPFLAGPATAAPSLIDGVAATLAVAGAVLYQWWPERPAPAKCSPDMRPEREKTGLTISRRASAEPVATPSSAVFMQADPECGESSPLLLSQSLRPPARSDVALVIPLE